MSHPVHGALPPDMQAGFPVAADRLRGARARLSARALEVAIERDPTFRARYDELGLRHLLRDLETYVDRLARSLASDDVVWVREWADWVAPLYRRRKVPMDDLVSLSEGLRSASAVVLAPGEQAPVDRALDAGIRTFTAYRRIAGDARKRNRILAFLYKGA